MGFLIRVIAGIQPVFDFMGGIWYALPFEFRIVCTILFAAACGYIMIRNLLL